MSVHPGVSVKGMAGLVAIPYQAAYSATKFALNGLVYALRYELKARKFLGGTTHRKCPPVAPRAVIGSKESDSGLPRI